MLAHPTLLPDMIKRAAESAGGYRELSALAIDPETGIRASTPYLNRLGRGVVERIPDVPHLRAIAAALGMPYGTVRRAAIDHWMPPPSEELLERAEIAVEAARKVLAKDRPRRSA